MGTINFKATTIIDNVKKALGDTDKSQFLKAISIIGKLSPKIFPVNVVVNFQCAFDEFFLVSQIAKMFF